MRGWVPGFRKKCSFITSHPCDGGHAQNVILWVCRSAAQEDGQLGLPLAGIMCDAYHITCFLYWGWRPVCLPGWSGTAQDTRHSSQKGSAVWGSLLWGELTSRGA